MRHVRDGAAPFEGAPRGLPAKGLRDGGPWFRRERARSIVDEPPVPRVAAVVEDTKAVCCAFSWRVDGVCVLASPPVPLRRSSRSSAMRAAHPARGISAARESSARAALRAVRGQASRTREGLNARACRAPSDSATGVLAEACPTHQAKPRLRPARRRASPRRTRCTPHQAPPRPARRRPRPLSSRRAARTPQSSAKPGSRGTPRPYLIE